MTYEPMHDRKGGNILAIDKVPASGLVSRWP
jgi:hypothetical protein